MNCGDRSFFRRKIYFTVKNCSKSTLENINDLKFKIEILPFGDELEFRFDHRVKWSGENVQRGFGVSIASSLSNNLRKYELKAKYFIIKNDDSLQYCSKADSSYILHSGPRTTKVMWRPLVQFDKLFDKESELMKGRNLRLYIQLEITKKVAMSDSEPNQFLKNYDSLVNNPEFSDFKFICSDGRTVYAHKCILMTFKNVEIENIDSPMFFRSMYDSQMIESKNGVMKIDDISSNIMQELLRFIYTGKIHKIANIALDLLIAADKYCITALKNVCVDWMGANLSVDNFATTLDIANTLKIQSLKENCIDFIKLWFNEIRQKKEFQDIGKDVLQELTVSIIDEPLIANFEMKIPDESRGPKRSREGHDSDGNPMSVVQRMRLYQNILHPALNQPRPSP